jgi:hypothetical protein
MTWIDPPSDFDPHTLAEFVEAVLLFSEDEYLSVTEIRNLFPFGNQPSDDEIAFLFSEIERRNAHFGAHYPYAVIDRGILFADGDGSQLYSALLLLSLKGTPLRTRRDFARSDHLFDAISREAFRSEQGKKARAIDFGWPVRGGRPEKFDAAVIWAAEMMGISPRGVPIPDHLKDGGVDTIVWRPFADSRTGFQITLVQNTVQWSFRKKPYDVRPTNWHLWWKIGTKPTVGFAIPFSMPEGDVWWDVVTEAAAVVMDRGRLLASLAGSHPQEWTEWGLIAAFVESELATIRARGYFEAEPIVTVARSRKAKH